MSAPKIRIVKQGLFKWIEMEDIRVPEGITERCTVEHIQKALNHLPGVRVASVEINTTGEYLSPMNMPGFDPMVRNLPDFCNVRIHQETPGGHVAHITVWVPLKWNGRFIGNGGGGNRTLALWDAPFPGGIVAIANALRNGFATAVTDAGNRDERMSAWGLDVRTRELDWELIRNWAHRSIHDMTVIGKRVTEAIHGYPPLYSYFQGGSGGGRDGLASAQRYPGDYDGIWSNCPAINWTKFIPAEIWPALVMKEHKNPMPPAKFEAFRIAVLEACGGSQAIADNFLSTLDVEFDPYSVVGKQTEAGVITETDALVMKKIWEGPRTKDGKSLWYGLRPGTESWGNNLMMAGLCLTAEENGQRNIVPFEIAKDYIGAWLLRDPAWDWTTLTFAQFEELFEHSVREFAEIATDNPDLSGFRDSGGKLLITHGANDEVIFSQGTVDYYRRVQEAMGGPQETASFARLFVPYGEGHGHILKGPGISGATGMAALMNWVENGIAPDTLLAEKFDMSTGQVTMTREVKAYHLLSD